VSTYQEKKTLEVRVDPGMKHGQKITMNGEADENPGMEPGDVVFVLVQAEHARFQRKGADLVIEKEISLKDALCGCTFAIKHLDERTLVIKTANQVITPNSLKMIPNEGFPVWKRPFEKGRLFILFKVKFPTQPLSDSAKKLVAQALQDQANPLAGEKIPPSGDHVEEIDQLTETTIEEFGKASFAAESANAYDSDDGEGGGHGHGQQKVQCANQ
jgi:DnaJ family protein A protein 2